jgi:microcystin-dependent protein
LTDGLATKANVSHSHSEYATDQELTDGLATKANVSHSHSEYATDQELTDGLATKANTSHTHDDRYYTESEVNALLSGVAGAIVGEVRMFARLSYPSGWLPCNGQSYNTTTYAALFAAIGYTYGGSGSAFNVPNMRDRMPMGASFMYPQGTAAGEAEHTLTVAEMPPHNHVLQKRSAYGSGTINALIDGDFTDVVSGNTGGGQPHNNIPPFLSVAFGIYAG